MPGGKVQRNETGKKKKSAEAAGSHWKTERTEIVKARPDRAAGKGKRTEIVKARTDRAAGKGKRTENMKAQTDKAARRGKRDAAGTEEE